MGCSDSVFAPVVFFFASLIFIGMMELSTELGDPFGADEVDFPVERWLQECVELLVELSEYECPHGKDGLDKAVMCEVPLPRGSQNLVRMPYSLDEASRALPTLLPGSSSDMKQSLAGAAQ